MGTASSQPPTARVRLHAHTSTRLNRRLQRFARRSGSGDPTHAHSRSASGCRAGECRRHALGEVC
eukprot:5172040-Prymnesium_polylepis.1